MADPVISAAEVDPRREKLYRAWDAYFSQRCEEVWRDRGGRWSRDYTSAAAYERSIASNRVRFRAFVSGRPPGEPRAAVEPEGGDAGWPSEWRRGPLAPRLEELASTERYTLYRLFYTIFAEVETDALVLVPPGAGPFPAVIAQHGLTGTPEQAIGLCDTEAGNGPYNRFGLRLAERGYLVIAPHMVGGYGRPEWGVSHVPALEGKAQGRGRTQLHRKALQCGLNLMGAEMFALSRAVDYLQSRPDVDAGRIGMYGLSQGGMSALWLPALDERVKVAVAAAYYNERYRKQVVESDHYTAYQVTEEEDKIFAGQLCEFGDGDIASLICPRAFMVEAGKQDGAVWWECAVSAFEEAQAHWARLGLGDRLQLSLHEGGHECFQEDALPFLDLHLNHTPTK